ncbi:MAG: TonB-dependent receptor [Pseudoflavonifractor sp.]|nr:TonB-dependent receptor [Pseudoflavonifractor sp.]
MVSELYVKIMECRLRLLALVALACAVSMVSVAADGRSVRDTVAMGEVTVTAIKLNPDVRMQPMASTVVGAGEIERLNIVTMKGVSELAPNFYIPDYGSRMTSSIYMRGIGARIDQPVVGLNVDNVPFLNKDNYDFDIADIERIEVLRGPQSTLYGRNTMGGLINIYTMSPLRYQGIRGMLQYGSANTVRASVSGYFKPTSALGMSLSAYFTHSDGFFTNLYNGQKTDKENQGSLRWKTQWRAAHNVTLENILGVQLSRQGGYPYEYVGTGEINYNDTCFYRRTGVTDGLTVKWNLGKVSLSSISSFQYIDDNMTLDQDFLPVSYFTLTQKRREWALTQDFVGRGRAGCYSWLGGVFGFYKHTRMQAPVTFKDYGIDKLILDHVNEYNPDYPIRWNEDSFLLGSDFTSPVWGIAAYHQSTVELGRWTLTAGLRLDYEHSGLDYRSDCNTSYTVEHLLDDGSREFYSVRDVAIHDRGSLGKGFLQLLPKVTATYRLPMAKPSTVYALVAKGYKAGGFNTQMFSDVLQQRLMSFMGISAGYDVDEVTGYRPEVSWNYEIGTHVTWAGGRVMTDLALFYIDCRDQQLTVFPDGNTTGRIMTNAGKTRSFGGELAVRFVPTERWEANLSYGYTNARFVEFNNGKADYSGKRIPYAPENTLFVGVSYTQPVRLRWLDDIRFNLNMRGIGSIAWDEANTIVQPFYLLPSVSVMFRHDRYSLDLWAENFSDTKYNVFYFVSISNAFLQRGKPRQVGLTLRLDFESR